MTSWCRSIFFPKKTSSREQKVAAVLLPPYNGLYKDFKMCPHMDSEKFSSEHPGISEVTLVNWYWEVKQSTNHSICLYCKFDSLFLKFILLHSIQLTCFNRLDSMLAPLFAILFYPILFFSFLFFSFLVFFLVSMDQSNNQASFSLSINNSHPLFWCGW